MGYHSNWRMSYGSSNGRLCHDSFGWGLAVQTLVAVYLQTPVKKGGYGSTPLQNAAFTVSTGLGVLAAQLLGILVYDRIPL